MSTACITGATAGIGASFANLLAARGYDLVLVARDAARLQAHAEKLRATHDVMVEVLPADLATATGRGDVSQRLRDSQRPVDILINNAGFGLNQRFVSGDLDREEELLEVLVRAVLVLTHAALPGMVERDNGHVINVSSVAGWVPMGTYSAAKSWVTVFSESLRSELTGTGVTVTAVCPGFTRTEFHDRAHMKVSSMPGWMWLESDDVAAQALEDALAGHIVSVPSHRYQALAMASRYAPRSLVRRLAAVTPRPRRQ